MDDIVRQAMAKWPNVPACYGWLGLDARGNWYMRDDHAQAMGRFPSLAIPGARGTRGSMLKHEKLIDFIHRNYGPDADGQWFFQNGPQRVYVELEATPYIWRLHGDGSDGPTVISHTGQVAQPNACLLDQHGRVYLETNIGFGLVHSQDVPVVANAVEQGLWTPETVWAAALPTRFGYVPSPEGLRALPSV